MKRKIIIILCLLLITAMVVLLYSKTVSAPNPSHHPKTTNLSAEQTPGFNKKQYSLDDPISQWVIVNKKRPLPENFAPKDLTNVGNGEQMRSVATQNLSNLLAVAKRQGINLSVLSAYRSYSTQIKVYSAYVKKDGQEAADTYSARPGHSEHQTGLAVDLGNGTCDLQICFGNTSAGKWLADHAHEYGFVIRYQKGWENLTGYQYEPWHLRYVGTDLSAQIAKANQTLEQFFGLPIASNY